MREPQEGAIMIKDLIDAVIKRGDAYIDVADGRIPSRKLPPPIKRPNPTPKQEVHRFVIQKN